MDLDGYNYTQLVGFTDSELKFYCTHQHDWLIEILRGLLSTLLTKITSLMAETNDDAVATKFLSIFIYTKACEIVHGLLSARPDFPVSLVSLKTIKSIFGIL